MVEGKTEALAFRRLPNALPACPHLDRPAVVEGIGADADPQQIARRVARDVAFLQRDNHIVVVCVDRESRTEDAATLATAIATELMNVLPTVGGRTGFPVAVVVADRAFEAWLLADIECLAATTPPKRCLEGYMRPKAGGRRLGYHYGDDLLETYLGRYEKTRDGPSLFERVNFAHARIPCGAGSRGSASLNTFLTALGA